MSTEFTGNVADDVAVLERFIPESGAISRHALLRLAKGAMRAEQAESGERTWRQRVEAAAKALEDVAPGELGRLDLVGRIERLKARPTTSLHETRTPEALAVLVNELHASCPACKGLLHHVVHPPNGDGLTTMTACSNPIHRRAELRHAELQAEVSSRRPTGQVKEDVEALGMVLTRAVNAGLVGEAEPILYQGKRLFPERALSRLAALAQEETEALRAKVTELEAERDRLIELAGRAGSERDAARVEVERLRDSNADAASALVAIGAEVGAQEGEPTPSAVTRTLRAARAEVARLKAEVDEVRSAWKAEDAERAEMLRQRDHARLELERVMRALKAHDDQVPHVAAEAMRERLELAESRVADMEAEAVTLQGRIRHLERRDSQWIAATSRADPERAIERIAEFRLNESRLTAIRERAVACSHAWPEAMVAVRWVLEGDAPSAQPSPEALRELRAQGLTRDSGPQRPSGFGLYAEATTYERGHKEGAEGMRTAITQEVTKELDLRGWTDKPLGQVVLGAIARAKA